MIGDVIDHIRYTTPAVNQEFARKSVIETVSHIRKVDFLIKSFQVTPFCRQLLKELAQ